MKLDLKRPCPQCPFRNDITPFISGDRSEEILNSISTGQGSSFTCHKTVDYDDNDIHVEKSSEQMCAGAMIILEKIKRPNQWMRWMERVGSYDHKKLEMDSPIYDNPEEMIEAHHLQESRE